MTIPLDTFSVCTVLFVCMCVIFLVLVFALPMISSGLGLPSLAVCQYKSTPLKLACSKLDLREKNAFYFDGVV